MPNDIHNPSAWIPVVPPLVSSTQERLKLDDTARAQLYLAIAKQFEVETNPRYVKGHNLDPRDGLETYCNIYQGDVMTAMGTILPHWYDPVHGAPVPVGKGSETSANGICVWMAQHGFAFGWLEVSELAARDRATRGYPTVVMWLHQGGIGHVGVILPGMGFTHLAQAGGTNFFDQDIRKGFGVLGPLKFYTHD